MNQSRTPPSPCPYCGATMDAATCVDGEHTPKPGDLSICLYCRETLVYNDDMTIRKISDREEMALPAETRFELFQAKLIAAKFANNKKNGDAK